MTMPPIGPCICMLNSQLLKCLKDQEVCSWNRCGLVGGDGLLEVDSEVFKDHTRPSLCLCLSLSLLVAADQNAKL